MRRMGTTGASTVRLPTRFGYKPSLDGLRAVAVGSVIAFHFGGGQLPGGFLGVDTFFVLSGYLITSLLLVEWGRSSGVKFTSFWARRARRLLPALFIVLVAIAVWAALALPSDELNRIRSDGIWTLFYGANWHLIHSGQSYFALVSGASPLRHAWSLAIEEQFYLVWPLLTYACLRLGRGRTRNLTVLCVVGAAASATAMGLLYQAGDPSRAYYGTDTHSQGLLIGALVAIFLAHRADRPLPRAVQLVGMVGIVVCGVMFATASDASSWMYPYGFLLFEVAVASVVVAVTQPVSTPLHRLLSHQPLRWVGQISYGLYLWHWPVAVAISPGHTRLTGWALAGARLGVTFGAATLSYYLIEQPIRQRRFLRGWGSRVAVPLGFAATAAALAVGTAGAIPPPAYLVTSPNRVLKTTSSPSASQLGKARTTSAGLPEAVPLVGPVALIGDSVAYTLGGALSWTAASHGVPFVAQTRPGCGFIDGIPTTKDGQEISWGKSCSDGVAAYEDSVARDTGARVVVAVSIWESNDRFLNGRLEKLSLQTRAIWFGLLDEARARLTAQGARFVLVAMPPPASFSEIGPADPDFVRRMVILREIYRQYALLRPGVGFVDVSAMVCAKGPPCPEVVDGIRLRPHDGFHFEGPGALWLAPRLYNAIALAAR
jgi:peptidoglycan/LPS O-acetylase OafA/YrhL